MMDRIEAREHLEMVDRILERAESPRTFRPYAPALIAIGVAAALLTGGAQLGLDGHGYAAVRAGSVVMLLGYAYLIWGSFAARRSAERVSASEARWGKTCAAVWLAVFIAAFAQPHLFTNWAGAAIWSLGAAIQMLLIGFFGDRRALAGGLILALSMPAANWAPKPGYVLAAGFILGYVIPGILKLFDRDECDAGG
jgi:hypothetical protein